MIYTCLYSGQGLGNQLWVYAVTRALAKTLRCDFSIGQADLFKGKEFLKLDFGECINDPNLPLTGPSSRRPTHIKNYFREKQSNITRFSIDVTNFDKSVLEIPMLTKIDGCFQSEYYIRGVSDEVKIWFKPDPISHLDYLKDNKICVINVRGGEYKTNKRLCLHRIYWENAIHWMRKHRDIEKFYIVTDDVPYAKRLLPGHKVLHQGMMEDYYALSVCYHVILSNSSWGYFPMKVNENKQTVIAPMYWAAHNYSDGFWSCGNNIYDDWLYMDRKGEISKSDDCKKQYLIWHKLNKSNIVVKDSDMVRSLLDRMLYSIWIRFVRYT